MLISRASTSSTPFSTTKKGSERPSRPCSRRKKTVSIGVEAMRKISMTSLNVRVAIPESQVVATPFLVSREQREQHDDVEVFF